MRALTRPLHGLLVGASLLLAGCPSWWTTTVGDSDGDSDTAGTAGTDSESGGITEDCGPPPAAPTCAPQTSSGTLTALCRARASQGDCLAYSGGGSSNKCAWVTIETHPIDDTACGATIQQGECIGLQASAASCAHATCGGQTGTTYYRWNDQCQIDVFTGSFCGYEVLDWNTCEWSAGPTETCAVAWPAAGPAVCKCAC